MKEEGGALPDQFQPKLNLPRGRGRARDCSGSPRDSGRSKHYQIRRIEIRTVQQIENFCAKLKAESLVESCLFQHREVPRGQARTNQRVPSQVAVETQVASYVGRS